jgi:frataxin-like iron-binding protein CyaY
MFTVWVMVGVRVRVNVGVRVRVEISQRSGCFSFNQKYISKGLKMSQNRSKVFFNTQRASSELWMGVDGSGWEWMGVGGCQARSKEANAFLMTCLG